MDSISFRNEIKYMIIGPAGDLLDWGIIKNATGSRNKDLMCRAITNQSGVSAATSSIQYLYYRLDGSTILGSAAQWVAGDTSGTAVSTRYYFATYVNSVMFAGTYTATANITCRVVALTDQTVSGAQEMGSFSRFYSTQLGISIGSGGKIIIQWTINAT